MELTSVRLSQAERIEWDRFCAQHCASFLCLSANFTRVGGPVRLFKFHIPGRAERIAQCAVRVSRKTVQFLDSLVIDPEYAELTAACLEAVFDSVAAPRAVMVYGSPWNLQPAITAQLSRIPRCEVLKETKYRVDAVDLREHGDAESLFRALNQSMRRAIRKAERSAPSLTNYTGAECVFHIPRMLSLHRQTYVRKGLRHRWLANYASLLRKAVGFGDRAVLSIVRHGHQDYAGTFSLFHDSMAFYVRGGTLPNNLGLSHYQHWSTIRECYRRGLHHYVMGYAYEDDMGSEALEAQRFFKKRFRSKEHFGSILRLRRAA